MGQNSSFLDPLLSPTHQDDGTPLPRRANINFVGFSVADNPNTDATDITNTGGSGAIALTDHNAFRALSSVADKTVITFASPPGQYVYDSTSGAGLADNDDGVLKLTVINVGADGRAYAINPTAVYDARLYGYGLTATPTQNTQAVLAAGTAANAAGGGVVELPSGEAPWLVPSDGVTANCFLATGWTGVTIRGAGRYKTTLKDTQGRATVPGGGNVNGCNGFFSFLDGKKCWVEDIGFKGCATWDQANVGRDVTAREGVFFGVDTRGTFDCGVRRCFFTLIEGECVSSNGIDGTPSKNVQFIENHFYRCTSNAINYGVGSYRGSFDCHADRNYIDTCGGSPLTVGGSGWTFFDNTITNESITFPFTRSGNNILAAGHTYAVNDMVQFRAPLGGTLPSPLVEMQNYFVQSTVAGVSFTVSATFGGGVLPLTTDGAGGREVDHYLFTGSTQVVTSSVKHARIGRNTYKNIMFPGSPSIVQLGFSTATGDTAVEDVIVDGETFYNCQVLNVSNEALVRVTSSFGAIKGAIVRNCEAILCGDYYSGGNGGVLVGLDGSGELEAWVHHNRVDNRGRAFGMSAGVQIAGDVPSNNSITVGPHDFKGSVATPYSFAVLPKIAGLAFGQPDVLLTSYAGSPEGNVTAGIGSFCADRTNGLLYVKHTGSGNTGWVLSSGAAAPVPSSRTLQGTAPITIAGDNSPHDLSVDRVIAIAAATTGALGAVELTHDLGGTGASPNVIGLTGTSTAIAYGGISATVGVVQGPTGFITWTSGPAFGMGGPFGNGAVIMSPGTEVTSFYNDNHLIGYTTWNSGNPLFRVGSAATSYTIEADQGTSQAINIIVSGTTPDHLGLGCDTILFKKSDGTIKGNWVTAGLTLGDSSTPGAQLDIRVQAASGKGLFIRAAATTPGNVAEWQDSTGGFNGGVDASGRHKWAAGNTQTTVGAAGGASALPGAPTRYLKVIDSDNTVLVIPAWLAS